MLTENHTLPDTVSVCEDMVRSPAHLVRRNRDRRRIFAHANLHTDSPQPAGHRDLGSVSRWKRPIWNAPRRSGSISNARLKALDLAWPGVKVYQDGLPDAAGEIILKIVTEVRSPNYERLRWLVDQGAEVVGTESVALIREEYERLQAVLKAKNAKARAIARRAYAERAEALLSERDRYIARRVAETLPQGGSGVLFIGEAHGGKLISPVMSVFVYCAAIPRTSCRRLGGPKTGRTGGVSPGTIQDNPTILPHSPLHFGNFVEGHRLAQVAVGAVDLGLEVVASPCSLLTVPLEVLPHLTPY